MLQGSGNQQAGGWVNNKSNLSLVEQSMTFAKINTQPLHWCSHNAMLFYTKPAPIIAAQSGEESLPM